MRDHGPPPTILAGVGYRNLRDHSFGVLLADELLETEVPDGVEVHDLSYNPVAVVQWLEDMPPAHRPRRMVFVSAVERGRKPGSVTAYRWDGILPDPTRIQRAVEDAVTGVIFLDNTLIVLGWFAPLADDAEVVVVEVEPAEEEYGETLSETVAPRYPEVRGRALELATADARELASLPRAPLGGRPSAQGAVP